jgi:hypothetical protein
MTRVRYLVGLLTLFAALLAGYWLFDLLRSRDRGDVFTLQLEFRDVRGMRAGADVKHRGVPVGSVRRVELREDGERAVVEAVLAPTAHKLVCYGSKFWIVSPRFLGLTQGATGLDTLIRDAYISFATVGEPGPQLPSGSQVVGAERPPALSDSGLEPIARGDLVMTLLVPENHDLAPGARVMFRGVQTGELRDVRLANDGSHVQLELCVRREHRHTVTDRSQFWVARPRLSGALLTGLALQDAAALLSPFLGYHTEQGAGVPVPDGHRAAALPDRPDLRVGNIPAAALVKQKSAPLPVTEPGVRVVRVFYQATERDFWSPDDAVTREGSGLLLEDADGRSLVVTTRSTCDGAYFVRDTFGARPDIVRESLRVVLPEGQVVQANRVWSAPDDVDLAALVLQDPPPSLLTSDPARLSFADPTPPGDAVVRAVDPQAQALPAGPVATSTLATARGGAVLVGEQVVGVLGQRNAQEAQAAVIPLNRLPPALRPKR